MRNVQAPFFSEQDFVDFVFDLDCTCVQALPEAAAKYGDQMMSLSDYFRKDEEGKLIESIKQICKIVAPDTILAELDPVYFTQGFGQLFQFLHLRLPLFLGSPQDKTTLAQH
jgi:hypothetical protein